MGFFNSLFQPKNNGPLVAAIQEGAFLVDVRTPGEFATGSVKAAVNIPLDSIPQQLAQFKGKKHIVVFCRSGNRSGQAKAILEQYGFQQVWNGGTWTQVNNLINGSSKTGSNG